MCSLFILDSTGAIQDDFIIGNRFPHDALLVTHHPLLLTMGSRGTIIKATPTFLKAQTRSWSPVSEHPHISSFGENQTFLAIEKVKMSTAKSSAPLKNT